MKPIHASRGTSKWNPFYSFLHILLAASLAACTSGAAPAVTLTPHIPWAYAGIAKPTYTPLPSPAPTSAPPGLRVDLPIDTSISAVIVPDTPAPDHSAQVDARPPFNETGKYILVDVSEQRLYAYEDDTPVFSFVASTGMDNATRLGTFSVLDKIPNAYGATWDTWMPNWLGIYYAGPLENGIHALPILPNGAQLWAGFLGSPISYGCVVLGASEAQMLYDWAEVVTPVEIQW
jgi:lipoprotein-anchoring transpeptidase ErfK/SrfK